MDLHVPELPREKTVERISHCAPGIRGELPFLRVETTSSGSECVFRFGDNLVHARSGDVRVFVGNHPGESEILFHEVVRHGV